MSGGVQYLTRAIGLPRAMGMLLTGRRVPAAEAAGLGLLTALAPAGGALVEARRWAAQVLECSPLALRATKRAARRSALGPSIASDLTEVLSDPLIVQLRENADYQEGARAFAGKRLPIWSNA